VDGHDAEGFLVWRVDQPDVGQLLGASGGGVYGGGVFVVEEVLEAAVGGDPGDAGEAFLTAADEADQVADGQALIGGVLTARP
jgi:hypothetical protein